MDFNSNWIVLRHNTYRTLRLVKPEWPLDLDLEYMQVFAAPFGGPLAIINDPRQIIPIKGTAKPKIRISNTAGQKLGEIEWKHGKLITLGWSDSEELICVRDDAQVFIYDLFGNEKKTYSMGQEASLTKIVDAKVFQSFSGSGVAIKTTSGRIFLNKLKINNANDFGTRQLPDIPKSLSDCTCWALVSEDRNSYCLLGRGREVIKLFPGESMGYVVQNLFENAFESILLIAVSYNHKYLSLYTNNGFIWLGSVDMKKKFGEFDTKRKEVPRQIEWIMNTDNNEAEAVVIAYPQSSTNPTGLLVLNCKGETNLLHYDSAIFLIPEMDGVRILTKDYHEIIQKLPKCVQNVFAINSQEPASFLIHALLKFEKHSHKSDEYISLFRENINLAVDECIAAAVSEFSCENQKCLLRAAYFGKGFIPAHNPDEYIRIVRILRVLNALRHSKIGMPLTYKQFMHLKPEIVLGRLVFRKHYAIAIQVAKHLKLHESWILEHWAYHKIMNDQNDKEVARKISEKFKNPSVEGVSFCKIAEQAHKKGRDKLAIKLLELEPRTSLHVPLLLKLGEYDVAVKSATQSGDTELVTTVLLDIKKKMMLANFHMTIREYPLALNIYKHIMNETGCRSALYDIFNTEDDHKSIAEYHFRNSLETRTLEANLPIIENGYKQGRCDTEAVLCSETKRLLKLQKLLTAKYESVHGHIQFYGMSVHDTIMKLLQINEMKEAEKIRTDFKVPEKRYWHLRVKTLAESFKWGDLDTLGKSKRSPISYEPFVEECLKHNNLEEARKYILKCREEHRARLFLRAKLLDEAAYSAFEQKDVNTLYVVQQRALANGSNSLFDKVNNYITSLTIKK